MSETISVKIKRFDKQLPLPQYHTNGAVCFDLFARVTTTIQTHQVAHIPLNIALEVPAGYFVLLAARSSTYKLGLMEAGGIGIGDTDYCGDADEYHFPAYNFTDQPVTINRGTRFAQMMILPVPKIDFTEVQALSNPNRGSFGTTGNN